MLFRFVCALLLVVLTSLAGVALESRSLEVRRQLTRQHFRSEVLLESYAALRWRTEQLGAPGRLIEAIQQGRLELVEPRRPAESDRPALPLLQWRRQGALQR